MEMLTDHSQVSYWEHSATLIKFLKPKSSLKPVVQDTKEYQQLFPHHNSFPLKPCFYTKNFLKGKT